MGSVGELRKLFLEELSAKGNDSIHPADLDRVRNSDHWLERFLKHNDGNVTQAKDMMWESVNWRRDFKTNDITEANIKIDIIVQGAFFPHGKDKDGCKLLVFKCIKHKKGLNDPNELKRCVIYWFERVERELKGQQVTLFFDMEGCGLSNMDMDFTKYLIGLFKIYYPFFLNYILIYEMPWVLNAAFKVIKSWLPEKAVEKIKFVSKKDIAQWVAPEEVLQCWGGPNAYQFSFIPEEKAKEQQLSNNNNNNNNNNGSRKVHFVEGIPMSDSTTAITGDRDSDGPLRVQPNNVITFVKEGNELVSTLSLENSDSNVSLSYKLKTTSPEKFRVKPSTGVLAPKSKATITVSLVAGYHIGGLSKDKFLIMSVVLDAADKDKDPTEIWKNNSQRKVNQIRLRCVQSGELSRNGQPDGVNGGPLDVDHDAINKLNTRVTQLTSSQKELRRAVRMTHYYQIATILLVVGLGLALGWILRNDIKQLEGSSAAACTMRNP